MGRLVALAGAVLAFFPAPAAAMPDVTVGEWQGAVKAYAQAGCPNGGTPALDTHDVNTPEDQLTFDIDVNALATGTCADDTPQEFTVTTTAHAELAGGHQEDASQVEISFAGQGSATWSQSPAVECCGGSSEGDSAFTRSFDVEGDGVPYAFTAQTAAQIPTSNDAGAAEARVTLFKGEEVVAQALSYESFGDTGTDTPAANVAGTLGPGHYTIRFVVDCIQVTRAISTQSCNASGSGQLVLGSAAGIPSVAVDQAPTGSGNPSTAVIAFSSSEPEGATFRCSLDDGPEYACTSPQTLAELAPGAHRFTIVARDAEGNDSAPAIVEWEVGPFDCTSFVQIGFARACGASLEETAPGSGIYRTSEKAWVGGFEIVPRPGGVLTLDTTQRRVLEEGAGVDVVFGGEVWPFDASALPVAVAAGDLDFNAAGTLEKQWFQLPFELAIKVAWADAGAAATIEGELKVEKLTAGAAAFEGGGGKLAGRLRNGVGAEISAWEVKAEELRFGLQGLQVPRTLKLNSLLARYARIDGKNMWEGGAGFSFPFGKDSLDLAGRARIFDGRLAGGAIKVAGIDKPIPRTPLVLQAVEGALEITPKWGFDLGLEATAGPEIAGIKLLKLLGSGRGGALASGCTAAPDPVELTLAAEITPLADADVGKSKLTGTGCLYATSSAVQTRLKTETTLGVPGQTDLVAYTGELTGWISPAGLSLEGTSLIRLPALPELTGTNLLSTKGLAACAALGFFQGGVAYAWGETPQAFSGCDLAPWQVAPQASAARRALAAASAIRLGRGLPVAGFSARGADGPPELVVRGPGGVRIEADGTRRSRSVVVVPVVSESRTYVFVRRPRAGRWTVTGDGISGVRSARGLPAPKVRARVRKVKGKPKQRLLVYRVRRLAGQRVRFAEVADGLVRPIGKPTSRRRGRIAFKPARVPDRSHLVEATVEQNGLPRAILRGGRFRAPKP